MSKFKDVLADFRIWVKMTTVAQNECVWFGETWPLDSITGSPRVKHAKLSSKEQFKASFVITGGQGQKS